MGFNRKRKMTHSKFLLEGLLCFYGGVVCLILLILVFIWLQEPLSIGVAMTGLVGFVIIPSLVFSLMDS